MALEAILAKNRAKGTGKKKIEMKAIEKGDQRMVTFSKRRQGLVKKLKDYSSLVDFFFGVLVFSPTGKIYSDGRPSVDKVLDKYGEFVKGKTAEKEEGRDRNEFARLLKDPGTGEFDDVGKLVALKNKLLEIKQKVENKIVVYSNTDPKL